jgi:hypothetical protein
MTESILLEASLFQLSTAIGAVEDPMFKMQLKLTMDLLASAVAAVGESPSPATVNDVEFALNDVAAVVGELSAADAEVVIPALEMMQADVRTLKESTSLPKAMIEAVRAFQASLRTRRSAVERQTYREGGSTEPLPYPPAELAAEATMLRPYLAKAGFATPALDDLIAEPDSLRFHSIGEILDELDVIIGG